MNVATACLSVGLLLSIPLSAQEPASVSVPMRVINNRVFIPVTVSGPHGRKETVQFWVDTGGGIVALSGRVARSMGMVRTGKAIEGMGDGVFHQMTPPTLSIAGFALDLEGSNTAANLAPHTKTVFAGIEADGFLPARVLKKYDVVFDYPHGMFTIGRAGSLPHRGTALPLGVQQISGFPRVEIQIGTTRYGVMLDTGAAYSGMSATLLSQLHLTHPTWPYQLGAIGAANMVGKSFDVANEMLVVPLLSFGPFPLENTGFVSRPTGVYEKYIGQEMTAPVVGVLAGNALRSFRLELDYPNQTAYVERNDTALPETLDCVGLIVRVKGDGQVEISGSAVQDGVPEIRGTRSGDRLLRIDGRPVTGMPLSEVLTLLSGKVGSTKMLTVLRAGKLLTLTAFVRNYLSF